MDIKELFTPAAIAANWTEAASNRIPYLGAGLFPARKKAGLDLSWLKGSKGIPISLMPSAFDAKATFRDRIGLTRVDTEMPFFREGFKLKEKDRQDLLRITDSADPYAAEVIARVYDDANELIEAADVVAERMRMQLLFAPGGEAGITIQANGVDYTYDYDANDVWKDNNYFAMTGNDLWTNTSGADPFAQIETVQNAVRGATGTELATMVMNSTTFNLLKNLDALKERFLTTTGKSVAYITKGDVVNVIGDTLGLNIAVYDKQFRDESKNVHKFVPDGYVSLIPAGALGGTWYGTTPEEADLRGTNAAEVAIVNTGVAITRVIDPHPVNVNTFASEIVLPSFERMDECALMKVTA